jgi:hypothetical protein
VRLPGQSAHYPSPADLLSAKRSTPGITTSHHCVHCGIIIVENSSGSLSPLNPGMTSCTGCWPGMVVVLGLVPELSGRTVEGCAEFG